MVHVEKNFAHEAHKLLGNLHTFLGMLISYWWFLHYWDHPVKPEACTYLPCPNHPVKTEACVVHLVR